MAKALIIKGANFAANRVAVIDISDPVYCTGISLNKSTKAFSSIGATETLTATVTPADTTDTVSWSSSNTNVATVANGVVTAIGLGSATITAACGNYSATCAITVSVVMNNDAAELVGKYLYGDAADASGNGLLAYSDYASRGGLLSNMGTLHIHSDENLYMYVMPANTARVKLTCTNISDVSVDTIFWANHETATASGTVKLITKTVASGIVFNDGVAIVSVPSVSGFPAIDAIAVGLKKTSGDFTSADCAKAQVEFLPSA